MAELYNVVVKNRHVEGGNVVVLEFESITDEALPTIEAGAHIDVYLPNGMIRQYSLCQNPQQQGIFRLGILNDPDSRGGSLSAFTEIHKDMRLQVSAPRNLFPLLRNEKHSVLIGGGIGITPLITMAYQLMNEGASFELHYCGKSATCSAFVDEIKTSELAKYTHFHFKDKGANHREFIAKSFENISIGTHVYTCGPNGFMDWVINLAKSQKVPEENIHKEYFQIETDLTGDAFEVVAQRSRKIIMVNSDETILSALSREGIHIEMSCEQGVCGTCMCDVIEGVPDHRDVYFTDEEKADNEQILVCCSRSQSPRLVLDI